MHKKPTPALNVVRYEERRENGSRIICTKSTPSNAEKKKKGEKKIFERIKHRIKVCRRKKSW